MQSRSTRPLRTLSTGPGRCDCGTNAAGGPRPASIRISPRRWASPDHGVGDLDRVVLVDQPAECPLDRVPLLAWRPGPPAASGRSAACRHPALVARGGSGLRGWGQAEASALATVRRPTPYLCSNARPDITARESRRIAAYSSSVVHGLLQGQLRRDPQRLAAITSWASTPRSTLRSCSSSSEARTAHSRSRTLVGLCGRSRY
jgi:hypothetical protein